MAAGARDLVQSMLQRDPQRRPTAAQLLQHPWLTGKVNSAIRPVSPIASVADVMPAGAAAAPAAGTAAAAAEAAAVAVAIEAAPERPLDDSLVQRLQRYGTWGRLKQVGSGGSESGRAIAVGAACGC